MMHIYSPSPGPRVGTLELPHGMVETPVFMPVGSQGTVKALPHQRVSDLGYRLLLANTYHLYLREGIETFHRVGGLHRWTAWPHNYLTDSGGYQVFSLSRLSRVRENGVEFRSHIDGSRHLLTPELVIDLQAAFGSDVAMPLDVCTPVGTNRRKAEEAVRLTRDWLNRSIRRRAQYPQWSGKLFGIVQGNFFQDLRLRSLEDVLESQPDGIAIGGLSVGEERERFEEVLSWLSPLFPPDKPRYVMGIGTPDLIFLAVAYGVDMFDCVFPTRVARNGSAMTAQGLLDLTHARFREDDGPVEEDCPCTACQRYSRSFLRHLFKSREILGPILLTEHNLVFMRRLLGRLREAILQGRFEAMRQEWSAWNSSRPS